MFKSIIWVGLTLIIACESSNEYTRSELLPEEYSWSCRDYAEHTEIDVWYVACDDVSHFPYRDGESLEAGYRLITGHADSRFMDMEDDCLYVASFILKDEVCMQLEEIVVIEEISSDG